MRIMKQKLALLLLILSVVMVGCSAPQDGPLTEAIFNPGVYKVNSAGINGDIEMEVTFTEAQIKDIKILAHSETAGISDPAFERIPSEIIETQSLNVDAVSGCTVTSNALLSGIEEAAKNAGADVNALKDKEGKEVVAKDTIEKTVDVVVIGGGGAGLSAATSAIENGATVIILEKTAALGGNTILAGGPINAADPDWQNQMEALPGEIVTLKELIEMDESEFHGQYVEDFRILKEQINEYLVGDHNYLFDSTELHTIQTYLGGLRQDRDGNTIYGDYDLVKTFTGNVLPTVEWLADKGVNFRDTIAMPVGAMWRRGHKPTENKGVEYVNTLGSYIKDNGGEILLETKANKLLLEGNKVIGVEAEQADGTKVIIRANNGVVMATGGFSVNTKMLQEYNNYWEVIPDNIKTTNASGQKGEGIAMGLEAGAALTGMEFSQMMPISDPKSGALFTGLILPPANYIFVNEEGNRFVDEFESRDVLSNAAFEQGGLFYMIADENIKGKAENTSDEKIQQEIEQGIIITADTLEDLAVKIGVNPETLVNTINKYNSYVDEGYDPEFGKNTFELKVEKAPFYATPRQPAVHHTMGGLVIDVETHVLNDKGDVIEGLYAAGEVAGGIHAGNRLGGNALADIFTFGRIAGRNAANGQ